jgi:hypothetical protein
MQGFWRPCACRRRGGRPTTLAELRVVDGQTRRGRCVTAEARAARRRGSSLWTITDCHRSRRTELHSSAGTAADGRVPTIKVGYIRPLAQTVTITRAVGVLPERYRIAGGVLRRLRGAEKGIASSLGRDNRFAISLVIRKVILSPEPVGFQKSATYAEKQFHPALAYSLIKPPRTGRCVIRS